MLFRQHGPFLVVHTPAKLNLFLDVLGKRADGFHELESLMVSVGLYDTLRFSDRSDGRIELQVVAGGRRSVASGRGPDGPPKGSVVPGTAHEVRHNGRGPVPGSRQPLSAGPDNLVVKAAELLRRETGVARGARIVLVKRIPLEAGLAGGSSDAAATLAALNRLWKLELTAAELHRLAARLGSDVNFFLADRPAAVCRGRGERVEPVELPLNLHCVIVRPRGGLSTAEVFRHCRPAERLRRVEDLVAALRRGRLDRAAHRLHNALQGPAERLSPEIARLNHAFSQQPVLGHLMSGSGTACFGLSTHRRQARHVAARLRAARAGQVFVAQVRP